MLFRCAGLKLNPKKCNLFRREVTYLGHVISADGVVTDPSKTAAIDEWPMPTTVIDVRRFVGHAPTVGVCTGVCGNDKASASTDGEGKVV